MGFFDNIDSGLTKAGGILERGAAAGSGNLHQYDAAQQNIAASKQNMAAQQQDMSINKLKALQAITAEVENLALSDYDDPEVIGAKLKQLQSVSRELGVPFDDKLVEHYVKKPLSLSMAFDKDTTELATDAEKKQLTQLHRLTMRPGPQQLPAMEKVDQLRAAIGARGLMKDATDYKKNNVAKSDEEAFRMAVRNRAAYMSNPAKFKLMVEMGRTGFLGTDKDDNKEPTSTDQLVANAAKTGDPADIAKARAALEMKASVETAASKAATERQERGIEALGERQDKGIAAMDARNARNQAEINQRQMIMLDAINKRPLERPLELGDREAISAMEENLNIARKLKTEFTPEERKKYVGVLANPMQRGLQLLKDDPKFAKFAAYSDEVKGFAFAEGGKNLTGTEKEITWGHLPIGNEFSIDKYMANLDRTLSRTEGLIKRRIELATTPRNRISGNTGAAPATATAPRAGPTQAEIDAAKKRLGIK